MSLETTLSDITARLRQGRFPNEQAISQGIVLRVLQELGWDTWDTTVVWPEYQTGQGRADCRKQQRRLGRTSASPSANREWTRIAESDVTPSSANADTGYSECPSEPVETAAGRLSSNGKTAAVRSARRVPFARLIA